MPNSMNKWNITSFWLMQERRTPQEEAEERRRRSNRRSSVKRDPIYGVRLGGKDRSYLIKNGQIDVLRNVVGGVQVRHCCTLRYAHVPLQTCRCIQLVLASPKRQMSMQRAMTVLADATSIAGGVFACCEAIPCGCACPMYGSCSPL